MTIHIPYMSCIRLHVLYVLNNCLSVYRHVTIEYLSSYFWHSHIITSRQFFTIGLILARPGTFPIRCTLCNLFVLLRCSRREMWVTPSSSHHGSTDLRQQLRLALGCVKGGGTGYFFACGVLYCNQFLSAVRPGAKSRLSISPRDHFWCPSRSSK